MHLLPVNVNVIAMLLFDIGQLFTDQSVYTSTCVNVIFPFCLSKESGSGEDDRRSQPRR